MSLIQSISEAFTSGGPSMWVILGLQILSIAIIVERSIHLYVMRTVGQSSIANSFEQAIKSGQLEKVVQQSQRVGFRDPVGKVIQAGALAALNMGGREEIQSKMDEVLLNESAKLDKRTGLLATFGNAGTLVGLLGTILGLIQAFSSVANMDPVAKAAQLTQGISLAMNTTAYGLIMAIPALVMFGVLQNRANNLNDDLNQGSLKAFNWLSFSYETQPKRTRRVRA